MNYLKTYIIWFVILIAPAIISKLFFYLDYPVLSQNEATVLTVITKFGFVVLTVWYGFKLNLKKHWSILLGISTLLPLMPWISFAILIKKSIDKNKSKTTNQIMNTLIVFIILVPVAIISYLAYQTYTSSISEKQNTVLENNTKSIANEQKNVSSVPFEKKAECAKLIPELEKRSKELHSFFIEIFYSSKRDSCLYISESYDNNGRLSTRSFRDAMTGESLKFETFFWYSDDNLTEEQKSSNARQALKEQTFDRYIDSFR